MNLKKYYIIMVLMTFIVSPIIITIGLILSFFITALMSNNTIAYIIMCISAMLLLIFVWLIYSKKAKFPEKGYQIFLPILSIFSYYMLVWIITFGLSNYNFSSSLYGIYFILSFPYFIINLIFAFIGNYSLFPLIIIIGTLIIVLVVIIIHIIKKKKIIFDKKLLFIS